MVLRELGKGRTGLASEAECDVNDCDDWRITSVSEALMCLVATYVIPYEMKSRMIY